MLLFLLKVKLTMMASWIDALIMMLVTAVGIVVYL